MFLIFVVITLLFSLELDFRGVSITQTFTYEFYKKLD